MCTSTLPSSAPQNRESGKCISALVQIRSSGAGEEAQPQQPRRGSWGGEREPRSRRQLDAAVGRQGEAGMYFRRQPDTRPPGMPGKVRGRREGRGSAPKTVAGLHTLPRKTLSFPSPSSLLEAIAPQLTGIKRGHGAESEQARIAVPQLPTLPRPPARRGELALGDAEVTRRREVRAAPLQWPMRLGVHPLCWPVKALRLGSHPRGPPSGARPIRAGRR